MLDWNHCNQLVLSQSSVKSQFSFTLEWTCVTPERCEGKFAFLGEKKTEEKLIRLLAFTHSLRDFRQVGKIVRKFQFALRSFGSESCSLIFASHIFSLAQDSRTFSEILSVNEMSSIYSNHRPGFWRVPNFKSKEPQPIKKKVHFYDDFVSVSD